MKKCAKCKAVCFDGASFCPSCGSDLKAAPAVGSSEDPYVGMVIGDKYLMLEKVGEGGMGAVYKAEQTVLGKSVAIKILHPHLINDSSAVARFHAEAKAASRLNHPNSISVIDFGETEGGLFYLVTEYLRGEPLGSILEREKVLDLRLSVTVLRQVLAAMEEAHRLGIVHRDLKPDNIFVETLGDGSLVAKVLDFGIAKRLDSQASGLTTPGMVCGTPDYMAPEQARGEQVDKRADIYALALVFYEMVTGINPFQRGSSAETMVAQVEHKPDAPSVAAPDRDLPESLDAILLWALAKEPAERFDSMAHFLSVLEDWSRVTFADLPDGGQAPLKLAGGLQDAAVHTRETEKRKALLEMGRASCRSRAGEASRRGSPPKPAAESAGESAAEPSEVEFMADPGLPPELADVLAPDPDRMVVEEELEEEKRITGELVRAVPPGYADPEARTVVGRRPAFDRVLNSLEAGLPVEILGEPGIGKSALMDAVAARKEMQGWRVCRCCPSPMDISRPLGAARSIAASLLGHDAASRVATDELSEMAEARGISKSSVFGLVELLDCVDTEYRTWDERSRFRERRAAWLELIGSSAREDRLLVAVDDVDLVDAPSQQLIGALAGAVSEEMEPPGLSLVTARSSDMKVAWPQPIETVELSGLTREEGRELASRWLDYLGPETPEVPPLRTAGGNPFFVEQAVRASVEGGPPAGLPRRIDLLDWRLERLEGLSRQTLQLAAILARRFHAREILEYLLEVRRAGRTTSQLKALLQGTTDDSWEASSTGDVEQLVQEACSDLVQRGFLVEGPGETFEISHSLIRQTVEAGLPAEVRKEYHRLVFDSFARKGAGSHEVNQVAGWLAHHGLAAGAGFELVDVLLTAGCRAFWAGDFARAVQHWHPAVDRTRRHWAAGRIGNLGLTADLVDLVRLLSLALLRQAEGGAAAAVTRETLTFVSETQPHLKALLLLDLGRIDLELGRPDLALEELQKSASEVARSRHDLWWHQAEISAELGRLLARRGDFEGSVEHLADGMAAAEEKQYLGNEHQWRIPLLMAELHAGWGRRPEAKDFLRNAMLVAQRSGSLQGKVESHLALARFLERGSRLEEGLGHLHEAVSLLLEVGDRSRAAEVACTLGRTYRSLKDKLHSKEWFSKGAEWAKMVGHTECLSVARRGLEGDTGSF